MHIQIGSSNNEGVSGTYLILHYLLRGSYFTSENITNIRYACLIKNYFSDDYYLLNWVTPGSYINDNIVGIFKDKSLNTAQSIGLLTHVKSYTNFLLDITNTEINISDRYNVAIRKRFSNATGHRYDNFYGQGVVLFRLNKLVSNIAPEQQICYGNPIFYQRISNDVNDFKNININNRKDMLTSVYPNKSILPTIRSKYDLNMPFPVTFNLLHQINNNPLNYEAIDLPFKFYKNENTSNENTSNNFNKLTLYNELTALSVDNKIITSKIFVLHEDELEYNNLTFNDNYYGITDQLMFYTKTSKLTSIPSFCDGKVSSSIFELLSGITDELVNQYLVISGKYNIPNITDINNFKQ